MEEDHENPVVWVHSPGKSDFSLQFDISSASEVTKSSIVLKEVDSVRLVDTFKRNLMLDSTERIMFRPSEVHEGIKLFAFHLDIQGTFGPPAF